MRSETYDVVVVGAGPVGENVADRIVQGGLSVAIVENELVGGDCSYWACIPSKALLRSGAVLRAAQRVPGASEVVVGGVDVAATLTRRNTFTHDWTDDSQVDWVRDAGIQLFRGRGRLSAAKEVTVTDADGETTTLTARYAVAITTGSDAAIPDISGLTAAKPWTSRDATGAQQAPGSLAIIGGGVVAAELATAYASFGTVVTILSRSPLLASNEPFAGDLVTDALLELGATVKTGSNPVSVNRSDAGVHIELESGETVVADEVLVATGRAPRTNDIGLETVGLTPGEWMATDDTLLVTGTDWLYACGDANHRALLTHQGKYQARAAGDVIVARALGNTVDDEPWGVHVATADHEAVPQVIYTDPEVASIGLTAAAAEKAGYDIRVVDYDLANVAGASLQADGYRGHARMVVDEKRSVIIGMTFVGQDVAEMVQAATIAVVGEVPLARLWHAVPPFPTISEVWLRLLEAYGRPKVENVNN